MVNTSVNIMDIQQLTLQQEELEKDKSKYQKVINQSTPQRRYGVKGVTKEEQQIIIKNKEIARANISKIESEQKEIETDKQKIIQYNQEVASYNQEVNDVRQANKALARQRLGYNPELGNLTPRAKELFYEYQDTEKIKEPSAPAPVQETYVSYDRSGQGYSINPDYAQAKGYQTYKVVPRPEMSSAYLKLEPIDKKQTVQDILKSNYKQEQDRKAIELVNTNKMANKSYSGNILTKDQLKNKNL